MIKYYGGKTRLLKYIKNYLPKGEIHIVDLFCGGGSCTELFQSVYGNKADYVLNDIDTNLINFYTTIQNSNIHELSNAFCAMRNNYTFENIKVFRNHLQNRIFQDNIEWAFFYYTCVYCGYGGKPYATPTMDKYNQYMNRDIYLDLVRCKKCLSKSTILNQSYQNIIYDDVFYYCDPPYCKVGANEYYGQSGENHKNFNHTDFYNYITKIAKTNRVLISYEDSEYIRDLYRDWTIVPIIKHTVNYNPGTKKSETLQTNEILVMNYEGGNTCDKNKLF